MQETYRWGCPAAPAGNNGRRRQGGLARSKHLCQCLIGAHFIRIPAANSNRANQLIIYNDREAAGNKVVRQTLLFAEVQADDAAIHRAESLGDKRGGHARVQRGLGLHQPCLDADGQHAIHLVRVNNFSRRGKNKNGDGNISGLPFLPFHTSIGDGARGVGALMTAFINVRLATSSETVTLLNGAGVGPCAQALALPKPNAATASPRVAAVRNKALFMLMSFLPCTL